MNNKKLLKALVIMLEFLAIAVIIFLFVSPFWPALVFKFSRPDRKTRIDWQNLGQVQEQTRNIMGRLPVAADSRINRVIIPKIGVNAPIIESASDDYALNRGSWRVPQSSTPDQGGNTVITAHRFKYLPPNNLTFYLLDKLTPGDIVSVIWEEKEYDYRVRELKIVPPTAIAILDPADQPILTLFTCDPVWSEKNRLVVIGDLIEP